MEKSFKKIVYITHGRLPTEKAYGLATVKICEAFADIGYDVEIVAPYLWSSVQEKQDLFRFYGIKKNFKIKKIFSIDFMSFGFLLRLTFLLRIISFSIFALIYALFKYKKELENIIFFSHDHLPLCLLSFLPVKIIYDIHHFPDKNFVYKRVMKKSSGFAVQTKWKIKALEDSFKIKQSKIVYWPNGTDIVKFKSNISKKEAREKLGLPIDKKIVLYTGQLFDWKGVDTLIRTVRLLDNENVFIYIVGGQSEDVQKLRKKIPEASSEHILFISFQPHDLIPIWLKAADVLVLPNTARQKVSLFYTSPMKLFEYMASGRPIVASAIPSVLEIINEENAFLAQPDSPESFMEKIKFVLEFPQEAERIARKAESEAEKYTWENRAIKISELFN